MRYFGQMLCIGVVASAAFSCTGYTKLLKGSDQNAKYERAIQYYDAGKYIRTIALLEDIAPFYTNTAREDTIAFYRGSSHYKQGDFQLSGEIFDEFRRRFGRSPFLEEAEYMYAKGFYFMSPAPNRDQGPTHHALLAINEYLTRYPNSVKKEALNANILELQQKLYQKSYINSRLYYNIGYYNSAVIALKNALEEYPETTYREDISYLIVASHYEYARNSVADMQRERFLNMQDAYYSFTAEFPESKYRKDADKMQDESKKFLAKYNNPETKNGSKEE